LIFNSNVPNNLSTSY